ncbi:MAG: alpha/beta fold hydrolase [Opitutus sp.]
MKVRPTRFRLVSTLTFLAALLAVPLATEAADTRAKFLDLIRRPAVPLAADVSAPTPAENGVVRIAFSFASDAQQRVPGILTKSTSRSGKRPVVIALHGTGGNKESQLSLLTQLAQEGFIGVAIDGRYHGARTQAGKGTDEYNAALLRAFDAPAGQPHEHPFFFDTVWDVIRLIDYLATRDDVDATRIGLIGFSKGGIEAYLAAAADPRIAVVVPCIGVQSFRWALEHDTWRSRVETVQTAFDTAAKHSGVTTLDAAFVHTFYDHVAPGLDGEFDGPAMLPLIAPRPLLSINGGTDARTPLPGLNECADAARRAYHAAGADDKFVLLVQPNTGHKVTDESMKTAHAWLIRWLKP